MRSSKDPELNIEGVGPTLGAAFGEAALSMTALLTDPAAIRLKETIEIDCSATSAERLLVAWLNAVLSEMRARGMVFGAFNVDTDGFQLHATVSGEHVLPERQGAPIGIEGATLKGLAVSEEPRGQWRVSCTVGFFRA